MTESVKSDKYPLSETLTGRVLHYLNIYRMFISVLLALGYFSGSIGSEVASSHPTMAGALLTAYLVFAAFHLFSATRPRKDTHRLARYSMVTDILFLSGLLLTFGGLDRGFGVLLIFTGALAAVMLPMRLSLFLASVASLAMIGEVVWRELPERGMEALLQAGLYSATAMVMAIVAHRMAYWARDYRLTAERHRAAAMELRQVNEMIIRRMRTGVIVVDADAEVKLMNESAWFLLGSPATRQRALAQLSPRLENAFMRWREFGITESEPILLEPSQAQATPNFVPLPLGDEMGTLMFLSDDNVIARRAMQMSVTTLGKLSSSIAHEIRNPLAAVTHAAQLLEESPTIKLSEMRLINIIQKQARRMNGIVESILQLSRREQSRPESLELGEFLKELVAEFLSSQKAKSVDFRSEVPEGETHVIFDPGQLNQCIWKLLDNAVDHAVPTRILRLRLIMRRDEHAGFCVISVEDNGPGIEKAQLKHIFEPFFTTRREGSGLGLYIARQLCEANQSELTVDSEPGQGARFHIRLALARAEAQLAQAEPPRVAHADST